MPTTPGMSSKNTADAILDEISQNLRVGQTSNFQVSSRLTSKLNSVLINIYLFILFTITLQQGSKLTLAR